MTFTSFNNARIVQSAWLEEGGRRLDCNPYMSGALEARDALKKLACKKDRLADVTLAMFDSGRESRNWVDDPRYGVRYMGSSAISLADLSALPLISNKQVARNPKLLVEEGWSLITRSGTIGRMAYVRPDMAGLACSEDVLRVVPNSERIPTGYLFAFLSCRYGVPLVASGTYGAIIQHIEPHHIADLPVPRFTNELEMRVHEAIEQAAYLRARANQKLQDAQTRLAQEIGQPEPFGRSASARERLTRVVHVSDIQRSMRMEGNFFNPNAAHVEDWILSSGNWTQLGDVADVYDVPMFKHIYVEEGNGAPFFTSGDLFDLDRNARKFLSRSRTVNLYKYILKRDWVLLARSGQLGGIIGRPQYVDSGLEGAATSDHVLRIVPKEIPGGYLFAYLYSTKIGYPLLTRCVTGHSIPALWPSQLKSLPIVLASPEAMEEISQLVAEAFEDRVKATQAESIARLQIENAIEGKE
ncbi:hypothetical protein [Pseudomonas sp. MAG733B]|uniref:methylation-associated defense system restriction endonuclease subunit S MAD5 n=1 Tax=Pseudomonas sp. MAG733B TaxID=3122079 RepID=UPI0030CF7C1D